jgi:hypothetical protein
MKTTIIAALGGFLIPIAVVMGYNLVVDPYHYYHVETGEHARYSVNARWRNPGLLRNLDYDSVLIGTSRSENFTPSMFLPGGWRLLKVTAPGSMAEEQIATLDAALRVGRATRVLIELSNVSFTAIRRRQAFTFPEFLYRPTLETPFLYLLSYDLFLDSLRVASGGGDRQPLEQLDVWWPSHQAEFGHGNLVALRARGCGQRDEKGAQLHERQAHDRAEQIRALDARIAENPNVRFIGFFPPMAGLTLSTASVDSLEAQYKFRQGIAKIATKRPNFDLYDYSTVEDIVLDLNRYKDPGHFDIEVNRRIAREILEGTAPRANLNDINGTLPVVAAHAAASAPTCAEALQPIALGGS